ncbi:MAG: EAL domain-containing protein [Acidimicrobiales bacterium]|nr:EAL domain-containing protein [Acidimicrobiales bacterium]
MAEEPASGVAPRFGGLAALEALVAGLTRPRLYAVDPVSLLEAPAPPVLAALLPEHFPFLVGDLVVEDQSLAITAYQRAIREGMSQALVRFEGDDAPTLFTIADVVAETGVLAYVFSDDPDALEVGSADDVVPEAEASASVVVTPGGKIAEVYGAIPGVLRDDDGALLGASLAAFVHPDDLGDALVAFAGVLQDHRMPRRLRARLATGDGGWRWIECTLFAGRLDAEGDALVSCSLTDVDADVTAREALAESEVRFRMLAESIPLGVFATDGAGHVRYANDTFRGITGRENTDDWLALAHPDDRDEVAAAIARFDQGGEVLDVELRVRPEVGSGYRTVRMLARGLRDETGGLRDVVGSMEDVTERKALQQRISHAATHDPLTGLANRAHLVAELDRRLAAAFSARDPLAVLFIDLDGFKRVNDSLGHTAGDQLLGTLADRLREQARSGDLVSRFGGDEFVVVAEQTGGPDGALGMAHRMIEAIAAPADIAGTQMRPRASIGVALAAESGVTSEMLLRDADAAMYEAKSRGANRVWLADAAVRSRADRRFGLEGALADALAADRYRFDYQPVVELASGRYLGAEGLLRWDDEDFGSTAPNEIIPLAEETGLIHQLTDWSVWRAGRDLRTVRADSGLERPFPLGINLSCAQLSSPSFLDRFLAAVAAVGFEPQDFVVEVTETELVEEDSMAERSLLALANAGTLIAIDDFGAGYSSFDYLTRMPVDFLKIDRRLTRALPTNARARRVLGALVTMCLDMGVALIGEGIETEAERTAYLDIGIQYGQGFLFKPGIGVDELVADLRAEVRAGR